MFVLRRRIGYIAYLKFGISACCSSSAASIATNEKVVLKKKRKKTDEATAEAFAVKCVGDSLIRKLAEKFKEQEIHSKRNRRVQCVLASVANYIRRDEIGNLMSVAKDFFANDLRHIEELTDAENELAAVVLKYAGLVHRADGIEKPYFERFQIKETDPAFLDLIELMKKLSAMTLRGDSIVSMAFCLSYLDCWVKLKGNEVVRPDFEQRVVEVRLLFSELLKSAKQPLKNLMLFSHVEYKRAHETALKLGAEWDGIEEMDAKHFQKKENRGYDNSQENLTEGLSCLMAECEYESPFKLTEDNSKLVHRSKEQYKELFSEQLQSEDKSFLKVENIYRTSDVSMECLTERWGWKTKIRSSLEEKKESLGDPDLKAFLDDIDTEECADQLLVCIHAAMCRGQKWCLSFNAIITRFSYIDVKGFARQLCKAVISLIHKNFLERIKRDQAHNAPYAQEVFKRFMIYWSVKANLFQMFHRMFSEYIKYYTDEKLSRNYTIRDYWNKCTRNCRLEPNFYAPFAKLSKYPPADLASLLVSIVVESCFLPLEKITHKTNAMVPAFQLRDATYDETSPMLESGDLMTTVIKMLAFQPKLLEKLATHQFEKLYFSLDSLPMKEGGPLYSRPMKIVRNSIEFLHVDVNRELSNSLREGEIKFGGKGKARPVFDALNCLGATPWMINKPMLNILLETLKISNNPNSKDLLKVLNIPQHPDTIHTPNYHDEFGENTISMDLPREVMNEFSKRWEQARKEKNELNSLYTWLVYRLLLAKHFADDCLFFPHNMDFRGRVYPISPQLNHMGDDVNRGILMFAKGKRLGKEGWKWLKLHAVNITGLMKKEPLERRQKFAERNLEDIVDSADDPFNGRGWWLKSDEPWQTLAACMEVRDALQSGRPEEFISHLPIHQDGSCNGLQHYAALGRDYEGAYEVNLVPNELPLDVYSSVVARVEQKRTEDEKRTSVDAQNVALQLREILPGPIPRKVLKQTVMTTVYGVTEYGARQQIRKQLKSLDLPNENLKAISAYLAKNTFASLDKAFTNSMRLKTWFQNAAREAAKLNLPVRWETPLGMPVVQPYMFARKMNSYLYLHPSRGKQANAFPPNFIHSLDSTHMMLTALNTCHQGITFAAVHDCFWTHASDVDKMNVICREQFVKLHEFPVIENLEKFMRKTYIDCQKDEIDSLKDDLPVLAYNRLSRKFSSQLSLGSLDIQGVKKSTYFFS